VLGAVGGAEGPDKVSLVPGLKTGVLFNEMLVDRVLSRLADGFGGETLGFAWACFDWG
jgi:hypothetical protein